MSWLFESGGQSIGASASASVLPMNGDFLIVYIYIMNFYFDSFVFGEHILHDFSSFKFAKICFMAQGVVYLDTWALEKSVSCSILVVFCGEFFSIFADFLSSFSVNIERQVLMSLP